jgi:hypothetical protein
MGLGNVDGKAAECGKAQHVDLGALPRQAPADCQQASCRHPAGQSGVRSTGAAAQQPLRHTASPLGPPLPQRSILHKQLAYCAGGVPEGAYLGGWLAGVAKAVVAVHEVGNALLGHPLERLERPLAHRHLGSGTSDTKVFTRLGAGLLCQSVHARIALCMKGTWGVAPTQAVCPVSWAWTGHLHLL